jgi:hypothetical protein
MVDVVGWNLNGGEVLKNLLPSGALGRGKKLNAEKFAGEADAADLDNEKDEIKAEDSTDEDGR